MSTRERPHGFPLLTGPGSVEMLSVLLGLAAVAVGLLAFNVLRYAYSRIGITAGWMLIILAFALLGSVINIPLAKLHTKMPERPIIVRIFGVAYRLPARIREDTTIVAVNVGGAVIPLAVSGYLVVHDHLGPTTTLVAIGVVAAVVYLFATPVPGLGVVVPPLVPPAAAALVAVCISTSPAAVAFVAATVGTLLGADVLNLSRVRRLGAPMVSIGGAGTFDAVFLSGLIAVLLAAL
jgi:uncharacterized membrane protein